MEPVVALAEVPAAEQAEAPERGQAMALVRAPVLVPVAELLLRLLPAEAEDEDRLSRHLLVSRVFREMYQSTRPIIRSETWSTYAIPPIPFC